MAIVSVSPIILMPLGNRNIALPVIITHGHVIFLFIILTVFLA